MDEVEYKLNTHNSVLVVNAVDKLISTIKSKFKLGERQKFVLENEELKFLREKCSSKDSMVSLTACQGLLALVELGVLEIGHTMSTVVTLLPSAHNHSAIISTMAGLLILDLKSRLVPGQPYRCQFSLKSPQHPFITVLEKNKDSENDVLGQMHALCTHPDYIVSSNSLELLRPVFLWLTCNPLRSGGIRPWQLLLSLPQSTAQSSLLLACLSCQQICNPKQIDCAFAAYSAVTEAALYRQQSDHVLALLPMLARISTELVKYGRDPRGCYNLIERCFALDAPELRSCAVLVLVLLAENLTISSAVHLHELFNVVLNIISKYEMSSISLSIFVALSMQWLHLPSYLTESALKVASKIIDTYEATTNEDARFHMPNLKMNKMFQALLYTDSHLTIVFKVQEIWERIRDNPDKVNNWFDSLEIVNNNVKSELLPFFIGVAMERRKETWFEGITVRAVKVLVSLVDAKKEISVLLLPILIYKIGHDRSPLVKLECLKALPLMAKTKENVPSIVAVLNKIKAGKGAPSSFLIYLYTNLAEAQVRCFPYLQELLVDSGISRPDDLKWEVEIARALAVDKICEIRPSSHGVELVPTISWILNRCTDKAGAAASGAALQALRRLWRAGCVAPAGTWRVLEPKLGRDSRPLLQISLCGLLSEVPALRSPTAEYAALVAAAARRLWALVADSHSPALVEAACEALANYKIDDYKLKDIPEVYRRSVKLPASYCKTPADAARKPEDVLDYVPCEVWPEVFKYTNQSALAGVERLCSRLVEREVRGYRSGVYQPSGGVEPSALEYLPSYSVVRGLLDCFRKQITSPSYSYPEPVLLSLLRTLGAEYPRPLPPCDLCCLHEALHRGPQWRAGCVALAARQAPLSGSARRLLENYLQGIQPGSTQESDILLLFEVLPILCRGMPPIALRGPVENCLSDSFAAIERVRKGRSEEEPLFVKQLNMIRQCLESEKIHDANRTLLSQIVENYFSVIPDDNIAWAAYVSTSCALSTTYLERMTSPSGWWEVTPALVRRAARLRAAVALGAARGAGAGAAASPLVWLNEVVDACATCLTEQEYSLQCISEPLRAVNPDCSLTKEWFLQLMARTQVAFNELEDMSAKLYLCEVFAVSVVSFSGLWALEPEAASGALRTLPTAAAALLARDAWQDCTLQMLEWLSHTRDIVGSPQVADSCQRALLALRHSEPFAKGNVWIRMESHFGKSVAVDV